MASCMASCMLGGGGHNVVEAKDMIIMFLCIFGIYIWNGLRCVASCVCLIYNDVMIMIFVVVEV